VETPAPQPQWIKAARTRSLYAPLPIQTAFVTESLAQPDTQTLDVFLMADPEDLDFARRLHHTLQVQGKSSWFNQNRQQTHHRAPALADALAEALADDREALETAENVVVVLSPHLAQNATCRAQLDEAQALSKRLIGVSDYPLGEEIDLALPAQTPMIHFHHHGGDFSSNFGNLYRVLESDAAYIDQHTRLLIRAIEWEKAGHDDSLLLRRKPPADCLHYRQPPASLPQGEEANPGLGSGGYDPGHLPIAAVGHPATDGTCRLRCPHSPPPQRTPRSPPAAGDGG
jgi:hypothetical protein